MVGKVLKSHLGVYLGAVTQQLARLHAVTGDVQLDESGDHQK